MSLRVTYRVRYPGTGAVRVCANLRKPCKVPAAAAGRRERTRAVRRDRARGACTARAARRRLIWAWSEIGREEPTPQCFRRPTLRGPRNYDRFCS